MLRPSPEKERIPIQARGTQNKGVCLKASNGGLSLAMDVVKVTKQKTKSGLNEYLSIRFMFARKLSNEEGKDEKDYSIGSRAFGP